MRVAFKHHPLDFHKKARDAARFAILAQEHGKFWEVHDALFENQRGLGEELYLKLAAEHGIPADEVKKILADQAYEERIKAEMAEAEGYKVRGTPHSFVNGKRVKGAQPYEKFKEAVDEALEKKGLKPPTKAEAPPAAKRPNSHKYLNRQASLKLSRMMSAIGRLIIASPPRNICARPSRRGRSLNAPSRARTLDPLIKSQLLYQLS